MPKVKPKERREDFVARCVPIVLDDGSAEDPEQAVAMCNSMWRSAQKKSVTHDRLLRKVRQRTEKLTEFNYGILTADRYVKRFVDEIGQDVCSQFMRRKSRRNGAVVSMEDVIEKASRTLTYINPYMEVKAKGESELPSSVIRPKNTLMIFRHVLTTSKKDRDGDILRTKGAKPDPKMLLLWQHVHTLPIGKMLAVASHTKDELQLYSCIVDMNELCHDAAVMIDNDMGRFSHGFRALDFLEIKEGRESPGGFDVKEFEILEESLVSVPANPDAETEEVVLSLVEGGKLTSGLMKQYGKSVRERLPVSVPVKLDVKVLINGQEVKSHANERGDEDARGRIKAGTSEEAKAVADEGWEEKAGAKDDQVKSIPFACLDGSWEKVTEELRMNLKQYLLGMGVSVLESDWVLIVGTFKKNALVCIERSGTGKQDYYRIDWETVDGKARFSGDPKPVEVEVTTEIIERRKAAQKERGDEIKVLADDSASGGINAVPPEQDYTEEEEEGKKMVCSKCDYVGPGVEGKCPECGAKLIPRKDFIVEKLGRVLSKANEGKIREAIDDLGDAAKMDGVPRGCKALITTARQSLEAVMSSLGSDGESVEKDVTELDMKQALAIVLSRAGEKELKVMSSMLRAFEEEREAEALAEEFEAFCSV